MILKSRDDLTMLSGQNIFGTTDGPMEKHCVLCGFGVIGNRDIEHSSTCALQPPEVTHVRITGVKCRVKEVVSPPPVRWRERLRLWLSRD